MSHICGFFFIVFDDFLLFIGLLLDDLQYGTPTGLGGYNCRHQFYPYFEEFGRTYKPIPKEVNDLAYQAEQAQRSMERKIREWDRKEKILKAGGQDATEASRKKREWTQKLQDHVNASKGFLKRDYAAEKTYSTGGTESKKKMTDPENGDNVSAMNKMKRLNPPAQRRSVGKIDPEKYDAPDLQTDDTILMKEREEHIKTSHPEAYEKIIGHISEIIAQPDIVLRDLKNDRTRWAVKKVGDDNARLVIKLSTIGTAIGYKNSVITGQIITKDRLDKYIKKGRVVVVYRNKKV